MRARRASNRWRRLALGALVEAGSWHACKASPFTIVTKARSTHRTARPPSTHCVTPDTRREHPPSAQAPFCRQQEGARHRPHISCSPPPSTSRRIPRTPTPPSGPQACTALYTAPSSDDGAREPAARRHTRKVGRLRLAGSSWTTSFRDHMWHARRRARLVSRNSPRAPAQPHHACARTACIRPPDRGAPILHGGVVGLQEERSCCWPGGHPRHPRVHPPCTSHPSPARRSLDATQGHLWSTWHVEAGAEEPAPRGNPAVHHSP